MGIEVTWLGHSTVVLDLDGARLVSDPVLRRRVGPLRRRGLLPRPSAWAGCTAILMSHLHHDHADLPSLARFPAGTPVLSSSANSAWLTRHGLRGVAASESGWTPVGLEGEVAVGLVEARHRSRPMPHRPNDAHGHLVRSTSGTVWFAGDTALFSEMPAIADRAGGPVDLALVPISGWGPRLSADHLGPEEAAQACALVGARHAVPVHWGTFHPPAMRNLPVGWMDRPLAAFTAALAAHAPQCRLLTLDLGGSTTVA